MIVSQCPAKISGNVMMNWAAFIAIVPELAILDFSVSNQSMNVSHLPVSI